jgi:1-acyl-sn-glycerol-3-phosphate acyltransferase
MMDILKSIFIWFTGSCYVIITFPITLLTWIVTYPFDRKRTIVHWVLMYESYLLIILLPVWKVRIEGRKKAVKGTTYVIISNHQSMLDIMLINCLRYRFKWISKIENFRVPVIGWYLRMADYITVERGNEDSKNEMMVKSLQCLKDNISIMIFPEGTRSRDTEIGFFRRGAFQLAMQAEVPVLPVLIDGTGGILPKHGLIFGSGRHIRIKVLDPLSPSDFKTVNPDELAQRFNLFMIDELKKFRQQ